jgi:hypothetical protein
VKLKNYYYYYYYFLEMQIPWERSEWLVDVGSPDLFDCYVVLTEVSSKKRLQSKVLGVGFTRPI